MRKNIFSTQHLLPITAGEICVLVRTKARTCGFSSDATLCKKRFDELSCINKASCCFPFRDSENACKGALLQCPQRFFSAFDATKTVHHTGTTIFEGHLALADKDEKTCRMDEYISPTKVGVGLISRRILSIVLNLPYPS